MAEGSCNRSHANLNAGNMGNVEQLKAGQVHNSAILVGNVSKNNDDENYSDEAN